MKKALVSMSIREDAVECKAPYVTIKYKYTEPWKFWAQSSCFQNLSSQS